MAGTATQYAPAERAAPTELEEQRRYFTDAWFFGELLHYVPDMVMILNGHRQVVYANRAVLETTGWQDLGAIVGKRPGEVLRCRHASETESGCGTTAACRYCGAVNAVLQSQKGRFAVEECNLTVQKDGGDEALDLRTWASPMLFKGQRFTFMAVGDIAEEKRRLFLERIFLHDVLNTASALRGFSTLLGLEDLDPDSRREFSRRIASISNRIIEEIEAHRVLVAAENSLLAPVIKVLDSRQVLNQVFEVFNHPDILQERGLGIAPESVSVAFESDATLLRRVLGNMVKNGIESSTPGERVTMGSRAEERRVVFWVHNPGYMPEKVQLQVFNRSFSTKGMDRGLGTYSMKYLTMRYLGGEIWFESTEAKGTTFLVRYPLKYKGSVVMGEL